MRIIVISPGSHDPREEACLEGLFEAGLERYHVRKPAWSAADLEAWIRRLPPAWRGRLVLHEHHPLVAGLGLGGRHEKDRPGYGEPPAESRSCHALTSLQGHLGRYAQVLFGPVFPSLSKEGYQPAGDFAWGELKAVLAPAGAARRGRALAIGGVTAERLDRCRELGFDGAAALGAVWGDPDPVGAYRSLRGQAAKLWGARHAA
jgi:thiamine-phosphate pyrophosphorylase